MSERNSNHSFLRIVKLSIFFILLVVSVMCFTACKDEVVPIPKPRMYPRVDFPDRAYQRYDTAHCDFQFEYPKYASISQGKYQYTGQPANDCWFNMEIPALNAALYCDYTSINDEDNLNSLINDAFKIVGKHNIKANYREEEVILNDQGVGGLLFGISGPVATPYQFFLTDSTSHFFRGSLYFNSKVNPDSMRIIHEFVKEDIDHMIETFRWKS